MPDNDQLAWFYYLVIPYLSICLLIAVTLCLITYKQQWFRPPKVNTETSKSIQTAFRYTQIICVTASMCGIGMDLSRFIISGFVLKTNENVYPYQINAYYSGADAFYYIGAITFYFIAFLKPYYTFKETAYQIHNLTLYLYLALLVAHSIVAIWYVFAVAYFVGFHEDPGPYFYQYNVPAIIMLTSFDFIFNTSLMTLFVFKLKSAMKAIESDLRASVANRWDDLTTKHALLFTITIMTNQIFLVTILIDFAIGQFGWYWNFLRGTENLANIVALYLSFPANAKQYYCLCGTCHAGIKRLFTKKREGGAARGESHRSVELVLSATTTDDPSSVKTCENTQVSSFAE
eukprot:CAMPEP_0197029640 /NCGR_PEP_ID=MMETSP1384-20130603/9052_1 /TAXON_ID=29189 /ORGANISM="Ammonia sp." /LENGTH=345 /DNA_ID=CAMNT_0042458847 /DNA_START=107 /DNA_END=1144 /DNA_ORIENTATION=+